MKQTVAALLASIFISQSIAATTPEPAMIAPLAEKSLLLDIYNVEQIYLVAVGERGHILRTFDGSSWLQSPVPVQSTLTGVYFATRKLGWAVGHDATILHTDNGGETWAIQQHMPEKEKPLLDVLFKDEQNGIAVGAYGMFYRTEDGGKTWKEEFHSEFLPPDDVEYLNELRMEDEEAYDDERASILPHFNRVVQDGRTIYLAGEMGLIAKSNDFGANWEPYQSIYQGSFFDMERTQSGNLLVAGLRGNVFRSLRNGTPWQRIETKTTALINDIVLSGEERIFLLGNSGTLLISDDDGLTFRSRPQRDGKSLIAGTWFKGTLHAVSEVGVKTITIAK